MFPFLRVIKSIILDDYPYSAQLAKQHSGSGFHPTQNAFAPHRHTTHKKHSVYPVPSHYIFSLRASLSFSIITARRCCSLALCGAFIFLPLCFAVIFNCIHQARCSTFFLHEHDNCRQIDYSMMHTQLLMQLSNGAGVQSRCITNHRRGFFIINALHKEIQGHEGA